MDSAKKQRGDVPSDLDWAGLVKEMEKIKDRVEETLDPSDQASSLDASEVDASDSSESSLNLGVRNDSTDAPMEEMLSGLGREEMETELAAERSSEPAAGAKVVSLGTRAESPAVAVSNTVGMLTPGKPGEVPESAMSLSVVGALKLRLELTRQSQTVQIHLEEAQLRVELSDGTQFRIPLNKAVA